MLKTKESVGVVGGAYRHCADESWVELPRSCLLIFLSSTKSTLSTATSLNACSLPGTAQGADCMGPGRRPWTARASFWATALRTASQVANHAGSATSTSDSTCCACRNASLQNPEV